MKHAPGAPVSVTLEATAAGLNVSIINGRRRARRCPKASLARVSGNVIVLSGPPGAGKTTIGPRLSP